MTGPRVLDLGCGEGLITRGTAGRGAKAVGIDPTVRLIERARAVEAATPTGATYRVDDGCTLATVPDDSTDWVTAGLSFNNVPDLVAAIRSIRRVLVFGGQLAFTVPHPCFEAPHARWVGIDRRSEATQPRDCGAPRAQACAAPATTTGRSRTTSPRSSTTVSP